MAWNLFVILELPIRTKHHDYHLRAQYPKRYHKMSSCGYFEAIHSEGLITWARLAQLAELVSVCWDLGKTLLLLSRPRISSANSFSRNFLSRHEWRRGYSYTCFLVRIFFQPRLISLFFSNFSFKILLWIMLDYRVWLGMYLVSGWCWSHFGVSLRLSKPDMTWYNEHTASALLCFMACFIV